TLVIAQVGINLPYYLILHCNIQPIATARIFRVVRQKRGFEIPHDIIVRQPEVKRKKCISTQATSHFYLLPFNFYLKNRLYFTTFTRAALVRACTVVSYMASH
ncbi:hypothetical protein, partial [Paludibacter sp. 221]|uniref:hypothetical protein n=1 Tax=Paludibacter sp. 221 TaxID=2302939 RepID=UPI0019459FC3